MTRRWRWVSVIAVMIACMSGWVAVEWRRYDGRIAGPSTAGTLDSRIVTGSEALAMPLAAEVFGDRLAVLDGAGDPAVHIIDPASGQIESLGGVGEGPCEFEGPVSLSAGPDGGVWVYDISLSRFSHVAAGDEEQPWRCGELLRLETEAALFGPRWLPEGRLVSLGVQSSGRHAFFDRAGRHLDTAGQIPGLEAEAPFIRQQAYRGELAVKPDGSGMVVALRHAGRIQLYTRGGELRTTAIGPADFLPTYGVVQGNGPPTMALESKTRFGYVDVEVTDEHIVALFSGLVAGDGDAYMGRQIHVFDWSGEFLAGYDLDTPVIAIALDEPSGRLYGVRHDPTPAVVAFGLPEVATEGSRTLIVASLDG